MKAATLGLHGNLLYSILGMTCREFVVVNILVAFYVFSKRQVSQPQNTFIVIGFSVKLVLGGHLVT